MSNFRRSWSRVGERAILPQKQAFSNSYLFSAVAPLSGDSFHLLGFDDMNVNAEFTFLTNLKKQYPDNHVIVTIDNAPCHKPKILHNIPGLSIIYLPPYSPELNPTERFFEEIRKSTANEIFDNIGDIEKRISNAVNKLSNNKAAMRQLLGYNWIKKQFGEVS